MLVQSPNFFGVIEDIPAIAEIVHKKGALLIVSIAEAISLGVVGRRAKPTSSPWKRNPSASRSATAVPIAG